MKIVEAIAKAKKEDNWFLPWDYKDPNDKVECIVRFKGCEIDEDETSFDLTIWKSEVELLFLWVHQWKNELNAYSSDSVISVEITGLVKEE